MDSLEGFDDCFLYRGEGLLLLVDIVEGYQEVRSQTAVAVRSQDTLMEPVRLAHQAAQTVTFDGAFEKRFGCPDEHFCSSRLSFGNLLPCHAHRPRREALALFVQARDALLTAEFVLFGKSIHS